ncbi:MAG: PH domain-containing protein [Gemmatimonadales bacterium]|nr:PH domain-containing protein [Gemmatimonadales bacterium]
MSYLGGERIAGIDAPLPPGEHVRWQGRPALGPLARHAFHVRAILLYFAALALLRAVLAIGDGRPRAEVMAGASALLVMGLLAAGIALLVAWLSVQTTIYAVTDRRVVLKSGIVLSTTLSLPFRMVDRVDTRRHADGSGDVVIALSGNDRIAYLTLWPYARPWRLSRPEPMLRAVRDFEGLATALRAALAEHGAPHPAPTPSVAAPQRPTAAPRRATMAIAR